MNIILHWPQLTAIFFMMFNLLYTAYNHDTPRDNHNFFVTLPDFFGTVLILYFGGFFG